MRRPTTALYGWLLADSVSILGSRVSMIAIPWFVLVTTGSPARTGLVAFAEVTPLVLAKTAGGPLIDRIGARRVAVTCDAASLLTLGAVPVLYAAGALRFPLLLLAVALTGALRGPADSAKAALAVPLAEHAGVPLERATGFHGAVERSATLLGAALAGVLITVAGPAAAVTVDAASFGACALLLALATRGVPLATDADDPAPYAERLRAGFRFWRGEPLLVAITGMVAVTNMLDQGFTAVLMPVWARSTGHGAGVLGLMFAVFSGFSVAGSLLAALVAQRLSRFWVFVVGFVVAGLPRFVVLAFGMPLGVALAVFAVGGFGAGFLNPILGAVIMERIPHPLLGRVSSLVTAVCFCLMPFGGVTAGVSVSHGGLRVAALAFGAAYLLATLAPLALPAFRDVEKRSAPAPQEDGEADPAQRRERGKSRRVRRVQPDHEAPDRQHCGQPEHQPA